MKPEDTFVCIWLSPQELFNTPPSGPNLLDGTVWGSGCNASHRLSFQNVLRLHWVWIISHIYLNPSAHWVAGDSFTVRLCFGLHGQFSIEDLVHRHFLVETAGRFHLAVAALFPPLPLFLHRWNRRHACVSSQYCPDILISATIWTWATDLKQRPSILHKNHYNRIKSSQYKRRTSWTHTFPLHAHGEALLVAAVLAAIPLALVNQALFVVSTCVGKILPDGPLEEAFASLTAVDAIVLSCRSKRNTQVLWGEVSVELVWVAALLSGATSQKTAQSVKII